MEHGLVQANPANQYRTGQPAPASNEEQVSSINGETTKILFEAVNALDYLTSKCVGPRPSQTPNEANKEPSRSFRQDAVTLRRLAGEVMQRVSILHEQLGYN